MVSPEPQVSPAPDPARAPRRVTRRRLLFGSAGAAALAGAGAGGVTYGRRAFASNLIPRMTVHVDTAAAAPGDLYYASLADPGAAVRATRNGKIRWVGPTAKSVADFRVQHYQGKHVYTWWESDETGMAAYAQGRSVVTDQRGHELVSWSSDPVTGQSPDEHEFLLADDGTAYVTSYVKTSVDLSDVGGIENGLVMDAQCVHVDLASGTVISRWSPLEHLDLAESYAGVPADATEPWDFFHINSIEPLPDGTLLVSARHTWALYKINPQTGEIIWRMGGKRSDFDFDSDDARFAWQHDARWESDGVIRLFDNGTDGTVPLHWDSAVRWLEIDEDKRTVRARRVLRHPDNLSASAMGNAQLLPNGNVLVGWGTASRISEFDADGRLVFDATLPTVTYRAFKTPN